MSETAMAFDNQISELDIRLTPVAQEQMANLLAQVDDDEIQAVRVFVSGGGCGGMTYGMTFTDRKTEYDCVQELDGVRMYVDVVALNYLKGVEIDYVDRPMGASFVFNNVFATTGGAGVCSACGASGGGCA